MSHLSIPLLLLALFACLLPAAGAAPGGQVDEVLFDRRPESDHWRYLHDPSLLGRLSNIKSPEGDGLLMAIPAERKKTEIGIGTKVPRVWLDEFGPAARVVLSFELDAGHSDRFSFHLTQSVGEWSLSQPGLAFYWK